MPSVTTTTSSSSSSGSKDGLSERERVLLKKFGGDLPLPSRQQEDSTNPLSGISNDWPGVVLGGTSGDLDGGVGGGVALAVHRSSDTTNRGSSQGGKKKEKVDAGIAPWLSADMGGDFGAPPAPISPTSRPTTKPTQPPLNHSPSAPHLSGYSPPGGSPSNSNHNSFSRARQCTVAAISSAPDKRRPGSKDGVERSGGGGREKAPGPLVPLPANGGEDKRKKSGFLGGLGLIKRKATKSKEESKSLAENV
ncbi:hypothetical protein BDY24DRAFT_382302 [Mrakia frigida]|uniref:uncharacterized protein n=1 Tax=Mrakia frigida TaxID=29902 RepID=UPI003FCC2207